MNMCVYRPDRMPILAGFASVWRILGASHPVREENIVQTVRPQGACARRPITIQDLFALKIANEPQCSPDGSRVVCTLTSVEAGAS